jgi:hypothetical protein
MTAEQAVAYGMIDHIIEKRPPLSPLNNGSPQSSAISGNGHDSSHS